MPLVCVNRDTSFTESLYPCRKRKGKKEGEEENGNRKGEEGKQKEENGERKKTGKEGKTERVGR